MRYEIILADYEIFCLTAKCEIKSTHRRSGFTHQRCILHCEAIFHPPERVDLVKKDLVGRQGLFSGGRGWIRTIEARSNRFTVCPLWPLGNSPRFNFLPSKINGAGGRTRTPDLLITNQLLYQLSYTSIFERLIIISYL